MDLRGKVRRAGQFARLARLRRLFRSEQFATDPYPAYAALRERVGMVEMPDDSWLLLRDADGRRVLRDPSAGVRSDATARRRRESFERVTGLPFQDRAESILGLDPPDHTRLRKLMQGVFTPRAIEQLRPMIEATVDDALDAVDRRGREMDVISDLAFPLPFQVICRMLGMPEGDAARLREWSHAAVMGLEPDLDDEDLRSVIEATVQLDAHLREVIEWKRVNPADDLLSALIRAEESGEVMSDDELVAQVALLFIAGHETTVNLLGNGTLALLRHRDQLERWRDDPDLDVTAVDELLRYDPPVQASGRVIHEDLHIDDRVIPAGHSVAVMIASANRDPRRWGPDADRLDLTRSDAAQHLSFGAGVHHCLGAALARMEGQIALGTMIRRYRDIELVDTDPAWNGRVALRGLDRLDVVLGPGADPASR